MKLPKTKQCLSLVQTQARHFPRYALERHQMSDIRRPPNPFALTETQMDQIKAFLADKMPDLQSFVDNVDVYESCINDLDQTVNLGFDLRKPREKLKGSYDADGAAKYA